MVILHAKPVRSSAAAGRDGDIVGRIQIYLAFEHSRCWVSCELIRDDGIGGQCTAGKKDAAKRHQFNPEAADDLGAERIFHEWEAVY